MPTSNDVKAIFYYYFQNKTISEINKLGIASVSNILKKYGLSPGKGGRGRGSLGNLLDEYSSDEILEKIEKWTEGDEKTLDSLRSCFLSAPLASRMINSFYIKNFKKIKELDVKLSKITVLVGTNSSGKSSIMQALQFMNGLVQSSASVHRNHQGWFENEEDSYSTSIPVEKIIYSPSEDIYSIAHNRKLSREEENSILLRLKTDDNKTAQVRFSTTRERNLKATLSGKDLLRSIENSSSQFTILSSGISGISHSEQFKNEGILRKATLAGDANSVFRNVLYLLSKDEIKFGEFSENLKQLYPNIELNVHFDEKTDISIDVIIKENINSGYREFPVELAGTGLLQCIHILSYLHWFAPKIFILDEPDAHLNENKQRKLAELLITLSLQRPELQLVVATHSTTLLNQFAQGGAQISWVLNGEIKEHEGGEDFTDIFNDLGALASIENVQNNDIRYLILTEDKNFSNLQTILHGNGLNESDYEIISFESKANFDQGLGMAKLATKDKPDVRVLIHVDRDNSKARDLEKIRKKAEDNNFCLFVTEYYELENYFTTFDHLKHVLSGKSITKAKIKEIIKHALDSAKEDSLDKLYDQLGVDHEFMKQVNGSPAKAYKKCKEMYEENVLKYVKGKTLLGAIAAKLEAEHGIPKGDILKWSPSLENEILSTFINGDCS